MAGDELHVAAEWLSTKLLAHAPLTTVVSTRVYRGVAPQGGVYPFVTFDFLFGRNTIVLGGILVMGYSEWRVTGNAEGRSFGGSLRQIASRIHTALHNTVGTPAGGGLVLACQYERPYQQEADEGGKSYRRSGGDYALYVQGT